MVVTFDVGHTNSVLCIDTDDKIVATGDENSSLILWTPDGSIAGKITAGAEGINAVCLVKSKPHFYAASGSEIYYYDRRNLKSTLFTYHVNSEEVNDLSLGGAGGGYLSAADDSGMIRVIDVKKQTVFKTLRKHDNICSTAVFRPDRPDEIISGGMDCRIIRWDVNRARSLRKFDANEFIEKTDQSQFVVNPPLVHSICISTDGRVLAVGLENAQIKIFDTSGKSVLYKKSFNRHRLGISKVHFAKFADDVLVSGGNDSAVAVWNTSGIISKSSEVGASSSAGNHGNAGEAKLFEHGSKVNSISSWAQNGNQILVVDQTNVISAYSLE